MAETSFTTVYPMDSKTSQGEDGLPVYDRAYNASDLRRVMGAYLTDGVFAADGDALAVKPVGDGFTVGKGSAMAHGLYIEVGHAVEACKLAEIGSGWYAHVVLAARFDIERRDAAVYAVISQSPAYTPVRDASKWELELARVDWRGKVTDMRLDGAACGLVQPFEPLDTDALLSELHTAVSQFDLRVGSITSLPAGATPTVTVRKPEVAGQPVVVDWGIPDGKTGAPGKDGDTAPTLYIRTEDDEPPAVYDNVWAVDDKATHTITALRCYETDKVYPGAARNPGAQVYPGGIGQWVSHKIAADLIAQA